MCLWWLLRLKHVSSHVHLFLYFFISFAFVLLICLFFLSSKNFKNMLKVLFFVYHMFYTAFPVWVLFSKSYLGLAEFFKFMALYLLSVWENSLPQSCPNIVLSHSPFLPHSVTPHSNTLELSTMIHFFPLIFSILSPRPSVWAFLV